MSQRKQLAEQPTTDHFTATDIIMQPTSTLIPYANNARTHSEAQVKQIAASIQAFGFTNPVLVDGQNGIIAGHGRILAAELLGISDVPTICLPHLTNTAKRAYILADNRIAINSGWDMETLAVEVQRIIDDGRFDVGDLGFDSAEVDEMLASIINGQSNGQPLTDPDDVPDLPATTPISARGDIWLCGDHRVMCGDSTDRADVDVLMDGKRADLCLTDPPYGLEDTASDKNNYDVYIDSKDNLKSLVSLFMPIAQSVSDVVVLTPGNKNQHMYDGVTWTMAWFMPAGVGRGPWGFCCWQPVLCFGKDPKLTHGKGSHPDALVLTETSEKLGHPCTKPIKVWTWILDRATCDGKQIYDPFLGSGTTLIACQSTQRICYGMEISPAYVDVIVNRWQNYTGMKAVHATTGILFNDTSPSLTPDTKEAVNAL